MHDRLLVLDIETVPDRTLIPPDWPADKFPKPIWHRIVAVSYVQARIERSPFGERYLVEKCDSGGELDYDEARLLKGFWAYIAKQQARVVTWNGKGFDIPVLKLRAMVHGVSAGFWHTAGDKWATYGQRYAPDWHCDLMEVLADYGAAQKHSLEDVAQAIGLPGKIGGHGSDVEAMIAAGDLSGVRAYCECDVLNLFVLYVRWALLSGRTDPAGHNASLDSLIQCLTVDRELRPHLGAFLDGWSASEQPMPMHVPLPRVAVVEDVPHLPSEHVLTGR